MKIGLVLDDTLDKPDGVQQYVVLLGAWLTTQGHEVHYLVGESKRSDIPNIHSLSRNIRARFNQNSLSIPLPASRKKIRALLDAEGFDVLHVQMPYSPFMAGRVVRAAGAKTAVIGTFHILPFSRFEAFATRLLGYILRPSLRKFSRVLAVSGAAAKFARESFGVTPEVIPNMVDVQKFRVSEQAKRPEEPLTITFLGRLVPRKGAMELLRAVNALPDTLKQGIRVRMGGKGELIGSLRKYVEDHGLSDVVQLDGFIAEEDKAAYLAAADIAIFPSLGGESFGIVLVEAMAAGAGITVGGDNPGYRSVIGRWPDALCTPQDTKAFALQLEKLITDDVLRMDIHADQQTAVNAYDVSVVGTKILDIYRQYVA